jgi:hypothetical protein
MFVRHRRSPRIFNPEVPPDAVWGDVGFVIPPIVELDRDVMAWWRRRLVRFAIGAGVAIGGMVAAAVIALFHFFLGAGT